MTRPAAQVLTLLELLQSGGVRTTAELAGRLGVDERTVRRYVDHLIDLDVPVESVRGRYGGYRLGAGYRMPPLMLNDDEALAVLLGLVAGQRTGLMTATGTAGETAAAKIRRVLPARLAARLDSVLGSVAFTARPGGSPAQPGGSPAQPGGSPAQPGGSPAQPGESPAPPGGFPAPESAILLTVADAVRHHRPVAIRYTAADGRRSERVLHPYGLVAHAGRWYVTGADPGIGADRTFRLDRIADARTQPGSFDPPVGFDPAERVLSGLAAAPHRHEVTLRIQGTAGQIRARLPADIASISEPGGERAPDTVASIAELGTAASVAERGTAPLPDMESAVGIEPVPDTEASPGSESGSARTGDWLRVELRVESLDWLPPLLASLDLPFVVERPAELRDLVLALAERLAASARRTEPGHLTGLSQPGQQHVQEVPQRRVDLLVVSGRKNVEK
jgi:predicted DNA-binding transcriptional regulator YafY